MLLKNLNFRLALDNKILAYNTYEALTQSDFKHLNIDLATNYYDIKNNNIYHNDIVKVYYKSKAEIAIIKLSKNMHFLIRYAFNKGLDTLCSIMQDTDYKIEIISNWYEGFYNDYFM